MTLRFYTPPNWPRPPIGWVPPPHWRPDPSWGPAPAGWQFWVDDPFAPAPLAHRTSSTGTAMVAVAAASCGLAGFVPPIWALTRRPDDKPFRRRMLAWSGVLVTLTTAGLVFLGVAGQDSEGSPQGALGTLGSLVLVVNLVLAVVVALVVRTTQPEAELPGVAEELARRRLREQYRRLAAEDPAMARTLCVGRPDLPRSTDDGGLLDLNGIAAEQLGPLSGLTPADAARVVEVREQLGRFSSLDELALYAELPDSTLAVLGERAVFF